jgi:putative hemolysin
MKESDIKAVALKHKLPMVPQAADTHPWAYADRVMAFGRDLVGEEWPEPHAFPPMPFPVTIHSKLGDLFARFDMQMYAVQFERRTLETIGAALGLVSDEAGKIEFILERAKELRIHPEHCALDSWWVKSLMEFWGNGKQDVAAQFFTLHKAAGDVLANGSQHDVGGGDVFISTCDSTEALQRACDCADGKLYSDVEPEGSPCPECVPDLRDKFEKRYKLPANCIRVGKGYAATSYNAWDAQTFIDRFEGYFAAHAEPRPKTECAARKQGTAGGNAPADCDWPGCGCDPVAARVIESLMDQHNVATTFAQRDVLKERSEQATREGFYPAHDDEQKAGTFANAAAAYCLAAGGELNPVKRGFGGYWEQPAHIWPFDMKWWKPKDPRTALVKAAALILAEIEKIDRAGAK